MVYQLSDGMVCGVLLLKTDSISLKINCVIFSCDDQGFVVCVTF